jgi:protein CpxP
MNSFKLPKMRATTAAASLFGAIVFAAPLYAAPNDMPAPPIQVAAATTSSPDTMAPPAAEEPGTAAVETRISELHKRLKITEKEQPQWDAVAAVMRDNAAAMVALQKERAHDAKSENAVDVVKSYSGVIQAHEDGMKKFVPAFENLYDSLSDSQKQIADSMFRGRARTEAKKEVSKAGN